MSDTTTETETPTQDASTEATDAGTQDEESSRRKRFAAKVREIAVKAKDRIKATVVGLWNKFTNPDDATVISSTTGTNIGRIIVFGYLFITFAIAQYWISALIFGAWLVWEAWNLTHVSAIFTRYLATVNSTRVTNNGTWFRRGNKVA